MAMVPGNCPAALLALANARSTLLPSLLCGTIPMSLTYVWLGSSKQMANNPIIGMLLSAFIPLLLWALFSLFVIKECE